MTSQLLNVPTVPASSLIIVSNVRHGELPNIEALSNNIAANGIFQPLTVFNVGENIDALEKYIPILQQRVADAATNLNKISKDEIPEEYQEAQYSLEVHKNTLSIAERELKVLKKVENPDESYRIIDGHRRYKAGILAGEVDFPILVKRATPDATEVVIEQVTTGVTQASLSHLDEGRNYRTLLNMGMTKSQIASRMGFGKRATIDNRLELLELYDFSENLDTESSRKFCEAIQNGEVKVALANKAYDYIKRTDLTANDFDQLFEMAMSGMTETEYREKVNKMYGSRKGVTRGTKAVDNDSSDDDTGDDTGAGGNGKPRRRPEKEIETVKDKFITMQNAAKKFKESKKDGKSAVKDEHIASLDGVIQALEFCLGGVEPGVPAPLQTISAKLDEEIEQKKIKESEERMKAKEARRSIKKQEKEDETLQRKAHRSAMNSYRKDMIDPAKKRIVKTENHLAELRVLIDQEPDKRRAYELQISEMENNLVLMKKSLDMLMDEWNLQKEEWYKEEEAAKEQRARDKKLQEANAAEAVPEATEE